MQELSDLKAIKERTYFTIKGKQKDTFTIDDTNLLPSYKLLLLPKNLEANYLKELEAILFNSNQELDADKVMHICIFYNAVHKFNRPIIVKSIKYVKLLPRVVNVLNAFFNKHCYVISEITHMTLDLPKETP